MILLQYFNSFCCCKMYHKCLVRNSISYATVDLLKENAAQKCFHVLSLYYKAPRGWCSIASDLRLPYKKGVLSWIIRIKLLQMCFRKNNYNLYSNIKTIDGRHSFFLYILSNYRLCEQDILRNSISSRSAIQRLPENLLNVNATLHNAFWGKSNSLSAQKYLISLHEDGQRRFSKIKNWMRSKMQILNINTEIQYHI